MAGQDDDPQLPRWLRAILSLSPGQLKVLGFLLGAFGATFEAVWTVVLKREPRLALLTFYASAMGLTLLFGTGGGDRPPPAGGT